MNETMNLHEYYRNHKGAINASIMDIACDLAVGRRGGLRPLHL